MSSFEDFPGRGSRSPAATVDAELCPCQKLYGDTGNQKKVLYLMCIGFCDCNCNVPLFCFEMEPWLQLPKTASLRPKNTDF